MGISEQERWLLLRWGPRHDSGVLYARDDLTEVWVQTVAHAVPALVSTGDFAPADMQYRMHREHLWNPQSGLWGEAYDLEKARWVREAPTASGNGLVALALARALREAREGTPAEMRGRWQRDVRALLAASAAAGLACAELDEAERIAREDGWLG